jgi:hypothetical protein
VAFTSVLHPIWFVILLRLNINMLLVIRLIALEVSSWILLFH